MRRIIALAVVAFFVAGTATVFAQQQGKERNLIKIIQKSLKPGPVKEENKVRGDIGQVTTFQSMYDYIQEHSAMARNGSLRTQSTK